MIAKLEESEDYGIRAEDLKHDISLRYMEILRELPPPGSRSPLDQNLEDKGNIDAFDRCFRHVFGIDLGLSLLITADQSSRVRSSMIQSLLQIAKKLDELSTCP